jgi:hypothetical protein
MSHCYSWVVHPQYLATFWTLSKFAETHKDARGFEVDEDATDKSTVRSCMSSILAIIVSLLLCRKSFCIALERYNTLFCLALGAGATQNSFFTGFRRITAGINNLAPQPPVDPSDAPKAVIPDDETTLLFLGYMTVREKLESRPLSSRPPASSFTDTKVATMLSRQLCRPLHLPSHGRQHRPLYCRISPNDVARSAPPLPHPNELAAAGEGDEGGSGE